MDLLYEDFPHILDTRQFPLSFIERLGRTANAIRTDPSRFRKVLRGKKVVVLFSQPSLRTFESSIEAAEMLGARVHAFENAAEFSSIKKGETIKDTIRILKHYNSDFFIIRWHTEGSVHAAADVAGLSHPVINAGDGPGQHPTQALLDEYTIRREFKSFDRPLVIGMVGDLLRGRTTHSLTYLLGKLYPNVSFFFISPDSARMKPEIIDYLKRHQRRYVEVPSARLDQYAAACDVLYMTRPQTDQEDDPEARARLIAEYQSFILTPEIVATMKPESIIMHPLPRTFELPEEIDDDPRARYFEQAENGLWVRMALLTEIQTQLQLAA